MVSYHTIHFTTMSLSKKYQKKSLREHIYTVTDTYVGSDKKQIISHWVLKPETWSSDNGFTLPEDGIVMERRDIEYVPAFYKIFDEILTNATDHKVRDPTLKTIKITADTETGEIVVFNDGIGIDVAEHPEYNTYIPTMIFGELLTSTNYNTDEKRIVGGKNGYGAKLTNIFSKKFIIETHDSKRGLLFKQTFKENMTVKTSPIIKNSKGKGYTKITFLPDYERFHMDGLEPDTYQLIMKRTMDASGCTPKDVNVFFNGMKCEFSGEKKWAVKSFEQYIGLYLPHDAQIVSEQCDRWEVIVCPSPTDEFDQISFVNGINTFKGGRHVDYIVDQVCKEVASAIKKKNKTLTVKPAIVRENIWVFIRSVIENPSFTSQTKEELTTLSKDFGSKCTLSPKFIKKLLSTELLSRVQTLSEFKENKKLKATEGVKKNKLTGIPKLDDAVYAGTKQSMKCTLIITEGDSAKAGAVSGLSSLGADGRKYYGVYPMRGKLLNVRDCSPTIIQKNKEITELQKIIGLKHFEGPNRKTYDMNSIQELRYGSIMIMTDADVDGSHIKGLLFNFFDTFWPTLLRVSGFMKAMITPIVKVSHGTKHHSFYTLNDYQKWKSQHKDGKGWHIKYYKGLGTSTAVEFKDYFKHLAENTVFYQHQNDCSESIDMAFNKTRSNDRKVWLRKMDPSVILEYNKQETIDYHSFIHKDLIHFSNSDNKRSIPSVIDGLKPSTRKILFTLLSRPGNKELKVSQLAGAVSERTSYHHGEQSLQQAIVSLAQNFVGSNNLPLLKPNGQYGTRLLGGNDSASPRYIFTQVQDYTPTLFMSDDNHTLHYLNDDGQSIEPDFYVPILPMLLINGTEGIGTGFSTFIPSFNPVDIKLAIQKKLKGQDIPELVPYYHGFTGKIQPIEDSNDEETLIAGTSVDTPKAYVTYGKYTIKGNRMDITELPIRMWTEKYKEFLEKCMDEKKTAKSGLLSNIKNITNYSTEEKVHFVVEFDKTFNLSSVSGEKIHKEMKLTSILRLTNMHAYNAKGVITKYHNVDEILDDYILTRRQYYTNRKQYFIKELNKQEMIVSAKIQFIRDIMEDRIVVFKQKRQDIVTQLEQKEYPKLASDYNVYDYLLSMQIISFSEDKVTHLEKQHDDIMKKLHYYKDTSEDDIWMEDLEKY